MTYIPQLQFIQELTMEEHTYGVKLKKQAFSGGEYQRHLLQKALQNKPQIIILDETVNALDEPAAKKMLTEILQTVPTVIMVSHSQTTLSNMKRIFELRDGKFEGWEIGRGDCILINYTILLRSLRYQVYTAPSPGRPVVRKLLRSQEEKFGSNKYKSSFFTMFDACSRRIFF